MFGVKGVGGDGRPLEGREIQIGEIGISPFPLGAKTRGKRLYNQGLKIDVVGAKYMHYPNNNEERV